MGRAAVRVICRKNAADAMARGGGSVCPADCHIYTVDRFPKKSGMARLHLSAFKLAGVIPHAGWAARFNGKSSHGLWMLDKSALFVCNSLNINVLWIFRCAVNPSLPAKKKSRIPRGLSAPCSVLILLPIINLRVD